MTAIMLATAQEDLSAWACRPAREVGNVRIVPVTYRDNLAKIQLCYSADPMRVLSEPSSYSGAERKTILLSPT